MQRHSSIHTMGDEAKAASDVWGQLVPLADATSPNIPLTKTKYIFGRNSEGCDIAHVGNKMVSGKHCYVERTDDGKVYLYDTSTNGTLLKLKTKVSRGQHEELQHGDEFYLVYKKSEPDFNIGYLYQDMVKLTEEEDATQDYSDGIAEFQETQIDDGVNEADAEDGINEAEVQAVENKRKSITDELEASPPKKQKSEEKTGTKETKEEHKEKPKEADDDWVTETLVCIICQELLHDCVSLQPCMHSFCAGCYSLWMEQSKECPSCRLQVDRINKNHLVNNLVEAFLKEKPEHQRPEEDLIRLDEQNKITRSMLYPENKPAPSAGNSPDEEAYNGRSDDDDNSDRSIRSSLSSSRSSSPEPVHLNPFAHGLTFTPFPVAAARPVCRQCANYTADPNQSTWVAGMQTMAQTITAATTIGAGPSTAPDGGPSTAADDPDAKTYPVAPAYTCPTYGNHVLCTCCLQVMPDRRQQYHPGGPFPPQFCTLCFRLYCHAYWGCRKVDCHGCLAKLKDLVLGKKCLPNLVLDNAYESGVFRDYLQSKNLSVKEVFTECLDRMMKGEYACINATRFTHGLNTAVCYACGLRTFKDLIYFYRRDIPKDEFPKEVRDRPDCYWGKSCRTQKNKPEHARRFNHICEQTRTA